MKTRTALAILSYVDRDRPQLVRQRLKDAIASLERTSYQGPILIIDDGSTCERHLSYLDSLAKSGRHNVIRRQSNGGISRAKNTCLRAIAELDVDIGFLAEDDVLFRDGWDQAYMEAMNLSGIQHFSWHLQEENNRIVACNGCLVTAAGGVSGVLLTFTREVLANVGGFKILPHRYGYEHIQWTYRNILAGYTPFPADIVDSHKYIEHSTLPSSVDPDDKKVGIVENLQPGYVIDRLFEPFVE